MTKVDCSIGLDFGRLKNFCSIVDKQSGLLNHLHPAATACFKSQECAKAIGRLLIPLLLLNQLITSHILPRDYDYPNLNRLLISPYNSDIRIMNKAIKNKQAQWSAFVLQSKKTNQVLIGIKEHNLSKRKKYPRHSTYNLKAFRPIGLLHNKDSKHGLTRCGRHGLPSSGRLTDETSKR